MNQREKKTYRTRESSSGRHFMPEEVAGAVGKLIEFEGSAQDLLIAKVKGQISLIGYLYPPLKITAPTFPPNEPGASPPSIHYHTVERGGHRATEI